MSLAVRVCAVVCALLVCVLAVEAATYTLYPSNTGCTGSTNGALNVAYGTVTCTAFSGSSPQYYATAGCASSGGSAASTISIWTDSSCATNFYGAGSSVSQASGCLSLTPNTAGSVSVNCNSAFLTGTISFAAIFAAILFAVLLQ